MQFTRTLSRNLLRPSNFTSKTTLKSSRRWLTSKTTNTNKENTTSPSTTPPTTNNNPATSTNGKFVHAVSFLPHPDKGEFGEDAYFVSDNDQIMGVADGVGKLFKATLM